MPCLYANWKYKPAVAQAINHNKPHETVFMIRRKNLLTSGSQPCSILSN